MINNVVLVGRLTKDPELRYTQGGVAVARFTVAVNRTFSNQQGDREADFINCVAWRKQAENLANFMRKGSLVGVQGRIQTGSYDDKDGKRVYTTDIVADNIQFLEPRNATGGGGNFNQPSQQQNYGGQSNQFNAQPQQSYQNQPMNQQNYTNMNDDPFSAPSQGNAPQGSVDMSDDDLPF
ncbi:single-stranded DNA-binding protein 1 [Lysinibacillus alkalisoli]|uniref:Single-stranded DNA-binding protein n=1 Tax=Lysinibacillus alkalisoli TaxID=1911548 RepID=A0A917G8A4_9BACI|nr:single-stranded DNA-binding protein [Lysinibacillus alkalisoli]GGG28399.1 single-stranded DNA-binding protein 1 [Lysinibacillus alkalisoli]